MICLRGSEPCPRRILEVGTHIPSALAVASMNKTIDHLSWGQHLKRCSSFPLEGENEFITIAGEEKALRMRIIFLDLLDLGVNSLLRPAMTLHLGAKPPKALTGVESNVLEKKFQHPSDNVRNTHERRSCEWGDGQVSYGQLREDRRSMVVLSVRIHRAIVC